MQRIHKVVLVVSVLVFSWCGMMATHELGHVVGAWISGGIVQQVVLTPFSISRTDVFPNPCPLFVVWLGPIIGCLLPLLLCWCIPARWEAPKALCTFFAGFCLISNGAYISIGAAEGVGDSGVMLENGSPLWSLVVFGVVALPSGLWLWHRLGSILEFLNDSTVVDPIIGYVVLSVLLTWLSCLFATAVN